MKKLKIKHLSRCSFILRGIENKARGHGSRSVIEICIVNAGTNETKARETHGCLFPKTKQFFGRSSIAW